VELEQALKKSCHRVGSGIGGVADMRDAKRPIIGLDDFSVALRRVRRFVDSVFATLTCKEVRRIRLGSGCVELVEDALLRHLRIMPGGNEVGLASLDDLSRAILHDDFGGAAFDKPEMRMVAHGGMAGESGSHVLTPDETFMQGDLHDGLVTGVSQGHLFRREFAAFRGFDVRLVKGVDLELGQIFRDSRAIRQLVEDERFLTNRFGIVVRWNHERVAGLDGFHRGRARIDLGLLRIVEGDATLTLNANAEMRVGVILEPLGSADHSRPIPTGVENVAEQLLAGNRFNLLHELILPDGELAIGEGRGVDLDSHIDTCLYVLYAPFRNRG